MTETVTVPLSKPIAIIGFDGVQTELNELTFHEATVGDMIAGDAVEGDMGKTVAILASMASVPYETFKKLRPRDLNTILPATKHLLGNDDTPEDSGSA